MTGIPPNDQHITVWLFSSGPGKELVFFFSPSLSAFQQLHSKVVFNYKEVWEGNGHDQRHFGRKQS